MKSKFIELFETSAIIQGTLALVSIGVIAYLSVTGQDIPEVVVGVVMAIVGFYFGTKKRLEE